jgi:hypothetical protein
MEHSHTLYESAAWDKEVWRDASVMTHHVCDVGGLRRRKGGVDIAMAYIEVKGEGPDHSLRRIG